MSRRWARWCFVALTVVFGVRAAQGIWGGVSFSKGRKLAREGYYDRALPLLDRGAVGDLFPDAHWLAGQVRLGLWQTRIAAGEDPDAVGFLLSDAYRDATAALAVSPASGWYWMALGDLYHQRERLSQHRQGTPLSALGRDPWASVGSSGRIAIGFMRIGLKREPNWYPFHDQLAYTYYDYRLIDETLDAVYRSALALPDYGLHAYPTMRPEDPAITDAFAHGALDALGNVPWLRDDLHRIALGRLEVRRQQWVAAETHLREALKTARLRLNIAEIHFFLGLSMVGQGRFDEAEEAFVLAEAEPPIEPLALISRADLYSRLARWSEACELLIRAHRLVPERLDVALQLSEAAHQSGRHDLALFTLGEAARKHPENAVVFAELVRLHLAVGHSGDARRALGGLRQIAPSDPAIPELERQLAASPAIGGR